MKMSMLMVLGCLTSLGCGYLTRRQIGAFQWYDQRVPETSAHGQEYQIQDRAAVIYTPQYQEPDNYQRAESEQVAMMARVFPVLIQFLSPLPLEQSPQLETHYQLALELLPGHHQPNAIKHEKLSSNSEPRSSNLTTSDSEPRQFGTRVTTESPSLK